jgi:hypothetical protein
MKRSLLTLLPAVAIAALVIGCGGKEDNTPVTVSSYNEYSDAVLKFGVKYPADWAQAIQAGSQAVFYSSREVADGFTKYAPAGQRGGKVEIGAMKGGADAMSKAIDEFKGQFTDQNIFKAPEQTTLGGLPATKLSYSFDVEDTKFTAERYYVVSDSVVTYMETAAIGSYDKYKAVFDSARASFHAGTLPTAARPAGTADTSKGAVRDSVVVDPPQTTLKPYAGSHFSISYPSNFDPSSGGGKGLVASVSFSGTRNDSYIRVDEFDTKGSSNLTLDKAVDQIKGSYGGRAPSSATVGGQKAAVFNYSGGKDVSSRAYLVLAGGKLFRITLNWYTPQQDLYLPVFEKAVNSFSAK